MAVVANRLNRLIDRLIAVCLAFLIVILLSGPSVAEGPSTEFLRFGKPLSQQNPAMPSEKLGRYQDVITKVEGPATCGIRSADGQIDVARGIDWNKVADLVELEVCLFFMAAELQDAQQLGRLLSASGFVGIDFLQQAPDVAKWSGIAGVATQLNGVIAIDRLPDGFGRFLETMLAHSLFVSVTMDQVGRPHDNQAIFNYK